jgi:general secretion pathway protein C
LNRVVGASHVILVALAGWLAAQCVLQIWRGSAPLASAAVPTAPAARMLVGHWQAGPIISNELPLTTLPVEYLGGFKARQVSATVVVLRYEQRQRTLARGQRLAPGILLQDIDELGLVFDNNGKRERLPWPAQRPSFGFKQQG